MTTSRLRRQLPEEFQRLTLTAADFHTFYKTFMNLRFPLDVSEVLDLRYLVNHAVDEFTEPPFTPDYRQFQEIQERELDAFSIDNSRHRERMLKTLALLRGLHFAHVRDSRDAEERLHMAMGDNRVARTHAVRLGLFYLLGTALCVISWLSFNLPGLESYLMKGASLLCAIHAWRHFHALPRLDAQAQVLRQQLNNLLRERVSSINWKTLVYKLALVLGFKQIQGVEVFHMESEQHETGPFH